VCCDTRPVDAEDPVPAQVLLVGARAAVLSKLADALRQSGVRAVIARDVSGMSAAELRGFGAVAFGRAVGQAERESVQAAFEQAGADVVRVDGLAPVIPVLVAQVQQALDRGGRSGRQLTGLHALPTVP